MATELNSLIESLRQFSKDRDWDQFHSPKNLACALSVEAAELLENFQWLSEEQSRALSAEKRAEVGEEKYRIWRIYLAGSAHAFDRGWLSLWQLLAGKPHPDGRLPHPLTRDYMYANGGR